MKVLLTEDYKNKLKEKVRSETSEDVSNEFSIFFVMKEADSFVGQSFVSKIVLSSGQAKLQHQSKTTKINFEFKFDYVSYNY